MTENPQIGDEAVFINNYVRFQLLVSKYTAIKQLTYSYIKKSLSVYTCEAENVCIKQGKFPLYKGRDEKRILYISGIALRLEKSQNQKAVDIANAIASDLWKTCGDVFQVEVVPPGWIYLELSHLMLAAWLQHLTMGSLGQQISKTNNLNIINPQSLFAVQYAHARCYSLLQQAHREELIQLQDVLTDTAISREQQKPLLSIAGQALASILYPNPIPWLNNEEKLRLNHPAEGRLISKLVEVVDNLKCDSFGSAINWEKVALDLSQAFENFWSQCRIWGKVKIKSPLLAQARLGLVMATQHVLKLLLEEKLGVFAPLEL
ncbi:DALR anticodon-binding domain-containing protein [Calothrix sp. NIES-2098]|uniref:DALR anticodon-binding domain-containing protein n=1 Tax=Calothrix sp. NIES-2098 TaxID=1954171 RepID=UPI000B5F7F5F|nr:arginyl tRNA synthetase anticodon binding protein [Calothrix sp. NIES-2098]